MKTNGQRNAVTALFICAALVLINANQAFAQEQKKEQVYEEVADMPKFKDGDVNTFRTWVMKNVKYPEAAKKEKVSGKVFAQFIVEKDGTVKDVTVIRGVSPPLDAEVIRVIKTSPKWTPGKNKKGELAKVKFVIAVKFALE